MVKVPYILVVVVAVVPRTVVLDPNPVELVPITIWLVWLSASDFVSAPIRIVLFKFWVFRPAMFPMKMLSFPLLPYPEYAPE